MRRTIKRIKTINNDAMRYNDNDNDKQWQWQDIESSLFWHQCTLYTIYAMHKQYLCREIRDAMEIILKQ